jgi:hypothetical protein
MKLRDHPLMTYRGLRSWPPAWTWVSGRENQRPKGELGVLKEIKLSQTEPVNRIFLYMDYENATYLGCLLIDHPAFCTQVAQLLQDSRGHMLNKIGAIDLAHTLS